MIIAYYVKYENKVHTIYEDTFDLLRNLYIGITF